MEFCGSAKSSVFLFIIVFVVLVAPSFARTIIVDCAGSGDFNDIQPAINSSSNGDIIIVADGIYTGTNNRNISFNGKAITLQSQNGPETCIIDCQNSGRGFYLHNNETVNSVVNGFTIQNGFVITMCPGGAGIYFSNSSATISNCIITNNTANLAQGSTCMCYGGGMCIEYASSPTITNCVISSNSSGFCGLGGGIGSSMCTGNPVILNTLIFNNSAAAGGSGIYCDCYNLNIANCTITKNTTDGHGGGVYFWQSGTTSPITIRNTIIWANNTEQIYNGGSGVYYGYVRYSDIQGGWPKPSMPPGGQNINVDPCFADPLHGDFHLKSAAGRWDTNQNLWVKDTVTSLCIDAGGDDSNQNWKNELWPHGQRINLGAYGGTPQASMSLSNTGNIADLDNNGTVDYTDLMLFADKWLHQDDLLSADLDRNGRIDFPDYAVFASHWLTGD